MLHLPSNNMTQCLIFSLTQLKQRSVPANQHKIHVPLATPVCLVYQTSCHIFQTFNTRITLFVDDALHTSEWNA